MGIKNDGNAQSPKLTHIMGFSCEPKGYKSLLSRNEREREREREREGEREREREREREVLGGKAIVKPHSLVPIL